jgi:hypothetical protein
LPVSEDVKLKPVPIVKQTCAEDASSVKVPCRVISVGLRCGQEAAMTIEMTEELRQALAAKPDEPIRLIDPKTNESYVVLRSELYDRLKALLEEEEDKALRKAWLDQATMTRRAWVEVNP